MAPHSKRSSASDLVCEANTKHKVWIRRCAAGSAPAVSPIVHARSAQVGIRERDSRRGWDQQLVVRGQLHSPLGKLVMRVAHVAPIRARCFNSKRTSFHVALELEHVESVDLRSAIRKADAVLPAFARAGQRGDTLKRVAQIGIWRGVTRQYRANRVVPQAVPHPYMMHMLGRGQWVRQGSMRSVARLSGEFATCVGC